MRTMHAYAAGDEPALKDIGRYIAQQSGIGRSPSTSCDVIDERCQFYADSPLLGNVRDDLGPDIRRFHVGNYEVLYRPVRGVF